MNGQSWLGKMQLGRLLVALAAAAVVFGSVSAPPIAQAVNGAAIEGSILGINDDPTGVNAWDDPLAGVRVAVFDADTSAFLTGIDTDGLGRYRISGLPSTAVKVRLTRSGWLTTWIPGTVEVHAGSVTDLGEVVMYAEAVVRGQVRDLSTMQTLAAARVAVFDAVTGAVIGAADSDSNGNYRVGNLRAGLVKVRATKSGWIDTWANQMYTRDQARTFALVPGQILTADATSGPMIDMVPAATVSGTVSGSSAGGSGPLAGAQILIVSQMTGRAIASGTSDAAGYFRLSNVNPYAAGAIGPVKIRISKSGWLTCWYPQNPILLPGGTYDIGMQKLMAAAAISGQVLSWMDPIGDARVTVFHATTKAVIAAIQTDGAGFYRVGGLPAGPIKVRATKPGYLTAWAGGTSYDNAATYVLDWGQQLQQSWDPTVLYLDIAPEGVVLGSVVGVDAETGLTVPLADVRVLLTDAMTGAAVAAVNTDANGNFRVGQLVPGQQVGVNFDKAGWLTEHYPNPITLQPFSSTDLGRTTMHMAAAVAGWVRYEGRYGGLPSDGILVTVYSFDTKAVIGSAMTTTAEGDFFIGQLPAGAVQIGAAKAGYPTVYFPYLYEDEGDLDSAPAMMLNSGQTLGIPWTIPVPGS